MAFSPLSAGADVCRPTAGHQRRVCRSTVCAAKWRHREPHLRLSGVRPNCTLVTCKMNCQRGANCGSQVFVGLCASVAVTLQFECSGRNNLETGMDGHLPPDC